MTHLIQQEHDSPVSEGCAVLLWLSAKWTLKGESVNFTGERSQDQVTNVKCR